MLDQDIAHGCTGIDKNIQFLLHLIEGMADLETPHPRFFSGPDQISPRRGKDGLVGRPQQGNILHDDLTAHMEAPGQLGSGNRLAGFPQFFFDFFPSFCTFTGLHCQFPLSAAPAAPFPSARSFHRCFHFTLDKQYVKTQVLSDMRSWKRIPCRIPSPVSERYYTGKGSCLF